MKKSELKKIIRECVREETQRRTLVERTLNEDVATIAMGGALAILGTIAAARAGKYMLNMAGAWLEDKAYEYNQAKKIAAKAERMEKYSGIIQSIADKFKDDKKLADMLNSLEQVPYSDKSKRNQRSKILSNIASHVKSKLEPKEAGYLKDVLKNLRGESLK